MEKRDLYDGGKQKTGEAIEKGQPVPEGRYYLTVVVWMQNSKGEFLIQKTVPAKHHLWGTTGGHPKAGESSLEGIITEIKEELGLTVSDSELKLFKTIKTEDDFVDLYYLKIDANIDELTLQEDEVEEVKWASADEIRQMIDDGLFLPPHAEFFKFCLEFLSDNKIIYKTKSPQDGREVTIIWHDLVGKKIPDKNWKQVHAIANYRGKIVMVRFPHLDMIHIPGGHIEDEESVEETLAREIEEETGGHLTNWEPIGYQERIDADGNVDYQLRVYAEIQDIVKEKQDYDNKKVLTMLVEPEDFLKVWGWENPIGERIQQIIQGKMRDSECGRML